MMKHAFPVALFVGWIGAGFLSVSAQQTTPPPPDNTKVNKQAGLTADQQSQTKEDLALVQQIRKAIVADKTLSTNAHNCKVITREGAVTLRGPVNTAKEKTLVGGIATKIAGAGKVTNLLAVTPAK
jgi:osmotically-inducible protein OsmY